MTAILALDLGTNCGWALRRGDGKVESGTERFDPKPREHPGGRFSRFRRWLVEIKEDHPDLAKIAYERVVKISGPGGLYTSQLYGAFQAITLMFACHHQLEVESYAIATIKKQFAGSGKASKLDMVRQCRALGFNVETTAHDEADAIAILHVVSGTCPLLTMSGATPKKRTPKPQPTLAAGEVPF